MGEGLENGCAGLSQVGGEETAGALPAAISSEPDSRLAGSPCPARLPPPPRPALSRQGRPPIPHFASLPFPQPPTSSALPPARFALIHPPIHQTFAGNQGPLRSWCEARRCGEQNKSPGGFQQIPRLVSAPPPTQPTSSARAPALRPPPCFPFCLCPLAHGRWCCESSPGVPRTSGIRQAAPSPAHFQ